MGVAENILGWILPGQMRVRDPYQSWEPEQYTPGNAAYVLASCYVWTKKHHYLEAAIGMLRRSIKLLWDDTRYSLHRWFIWYFATLAYGILRDHVDAETKECWKNALRDPQVPAPHKLNLMALSIGVEIFHEAYDIAPLDEKQVSEWLATIRNQQTSKGFINDHLRGDGMPTAYHIKSAAILCAAAAVARTRSDLPRLRFLVEQLDEILRPAVEWVICCVDETGNPAMAERSRHQLFTWGAWQACLAYFGVNPQDKLVRGHNMEWQKYQRSDGTFEITPNHLSPLIRCGYERYSTFSVYNSLNAAFLAIAVQIREGIFLKPATQTIESSCITDLFIDEKAGYVIWRTAEGMLAVCLRTHAYRYMPALTIYHLHFNNRRRSPIANPRWDVLGDHHLSAKEDWSESDGGPYIAYWWEDNDGGPVEGVFVEKDGKRLWCDWGQSADVNVIDGSLVLHGERAEFSITRRIRWQNCRLIMEDELNPQMPLDAVAHVFPLVTTDGRSEMTWRGQGNVFEHVLDSETYRFEALQGGMWDLATRKSLASTSGITSQLRLRKTDFGVSNIRVVACIQAL